MKSRYEDNEWLAIRANTIENVNLIQSLLTDSDRVYLDQDDYAIWLHSKSTKRNYRFYYYDDEFNVRIYTSWDTYDGTDEWDDWFHYKSDFSEGLIEFLYSSGTKPKETFAERMMYAHLYDNGENAFANCYGDCSVLRDFQVPSHWTSLKDIFNRSEFEDDAEDETIDLSGWDVSHINDFTRMFWSCEIEKIVLDDWRIKNPDANFKDMFRGTLRDLSLRNWQLPDDLSVKYIIEEDDFFQEKGYILDKWAEPEYLTVDISGCDKHTASCLFSRLMYGYKWAIKFVMDEDSEAKKVYDSFISLLKENDNFSYEERNSDRRKEYLSRLYKSPFFHISDVDDMDFACDGCWKKFLDVEDWRIRSYFSSEK